MSVNPFKEIGPHRFGHYFLQGYNAHTIFRKWVNERSEDIATVLEVGCGYFEYYSYFFQSLGIAYTGLDLEQDIVNFRKNINPEQEFICADFFNYSTAKRYDLVCHHMVLSGLLSMEKNLRLLERTVKLSNKYGFGVFWNTNGIVIGDIILHLTKLKCENVVVFKEPTGLHKEQPQYQIIVNWERNVENTD